MKPTTKTIPLCVTCPYCKGAAYQLKGNLATTEPGRTRFGCDNAHYFVYPERDGYAPVSQRKEAA